MKDNFQIFDEHLEKIGSLIEQSQFDACANVCFNLTTYSAMSDYQDGLLISEILEGVFTQIVPSFTKYDIPDEERRQFIQKIKNAVADIANSYNSDDKNQAYNALSKIRNTTTQFQIKCWGTFPKKPKMLGRKEI